MFTLNAKLIEQAAASGSPRDFTNALANCATPLQHRGPIANSQTPGGYALGGFDGAHQYPEGYALGGPQVDLKFITVNIPPWQNIPFTPTPLVDMPVQWSDDYRPTIPGGGPYGSTGGNASATAADPVLSGGEPSLAVPGLAMLGDTLAKNLSTGKVVSEIIANRGDIANRGRLRNAGDVAVGTPRGKSGAGTGAKGGGSIYNHGDSYTAGTATSDGPTINRGTVNNSFVTNTQAVNNYGVSNSFSTVNNFGPTYTYAPSYFYSPAAFDRTSQFNQDLVIAGNLTVGGDARIGGDLRVGDDTLTLGNVRHELGSGDIFRVSRGAGSPIVSVDAIAPPAPGSGSGWLNVTAPTFLGGDTHLWRNYVYVSTNGNEANYTKLTLQKIDVVTGISWSGTALSLTRTPYWVLAKQDPAGPQTTVVLQC